MSYEDAPSTQLVATHCAVCNRPLVDAVSVETGIGPDCRARYGYDVQAEPEARQAANKLVHDLAAGAFEGAALVGVLNDLRALGFAKLSGRIAYKKAVIAIEEGPGGLWVRTPYRPESVPSFRRIPGRHWDGERKVNIIPETRKADLWQVLRAHFAGALAVGPKGAFLV